MTIYARVFLAFLSGLMRADDMTDAYLFHTRLVRISEALRDTDPPERLAEALARLRRRGCKIIWLNPLKGWKDYAPGAGGMTAAQPYPDLFSPATTLADLAALEPELERL